MEAPGCGWRASDELRGYVVRIDTGTEKGHVAVGVVFTDYLESQVHKTFYSGAQHAAPLLLLGLSVPLL